MSIVRSFLAHTVEAGIPVTRDMAIRLKQADISESRAERLGSAAVEAARAKSVSVCKKVVTDHFVDALVDFDGIHAAMEVLALAWGKGIEKVEVPESVKLANAELLAWRKTL